MSISSLELEPDTYTISVENQIYMDILIKRKQNIIQNTLIASEVLDPVVLTYNVPNICFNVFGCWNSMNNNTLMSSESSSFKDSKSLPILSDMIHRANAFIKPTFTVIVGDNYYSSNEKNVKKNVDIGFDIIAKDDVPHFILFGNHDVAKYDTMLYQIKKTYDNTTINSSITFGKWILPGANYLLKIKTHHLECYILMIDTNVFVDKFDGLPTDRTNIQASILSWIDKTLDEVKKLGPVFIAGHHPFFAFGHKMKNPIIENSGLSVIYDLMIKHGIKFYMCADEHNFQYIHDFDHDIHHIITGGSSSGDESFTFMYNQTPYDSRGTKLPIKGKNLFGKMVINSPHFTNITINQSKIEIKVISLTLNQNHSIDYLKEKCHTVGSLDTIESFSKYYSIVYSVDIPKYRDFIYISNCQEYISRIEKELEAIRKTEGELKVEHQNISPNKKPEEASNTGGPIIEGGKYSVIQSKKINIYKLNWNKIDNHKIDYRSDYNLH